MPHYKGKHAKPPSRFRLVGLIALAVAFLLLLAYPFFEPSMLEVEQTEIRAADLPKGVDRLRVVYLTDIHDGAYFNSYGIQSLVRRVNTLGADIVVLGGDYRGTPADTIRFFETVPRINARYAVCAVLGSSDRPTDGDQMNQLLSAMHNKGITPLINEVLPLRLGEGAVYVAGTDDVHGGKPDLRAVASRVTREEFVIYASHSPTVIQESLSTVDANGKTGWYDLGFFGETHGGQISFAGNLLNLSTVSDRYRQGWLQENKIHLLVSRGVGLSVVPIRLFCRPQIHLVTLVK